MSLPVDRDLTVGQVNWGPANKPEGIQVPREALRVSKQLSELERAEIAKLNAEAESYQAEARFHRLQSDRLERSWHDEGAELDRQRILDFTNDVNYLTAQYAINRLAQWRAQSKAPITVRMLTPGGEVISGLALFDYIRSLVAEGIEVTTHAIGMAASMGTILLQAGSKRLVSPSAWLMVHEVSSELGGKLSEMIDGAKWNKRVQDRLLDILSERAKVSKRTIATRWTRKDWWLTAEEAVEVGFADAVAL